MIIPYNIGKNSNGESQFIDLTSYPLLMISHCDSGQLEESISKINQSGDYAASRCYIMTLKRRLAVSESSQPSEVFLRDEPLEGSVKRGNCS